MDDVDNIGVPDWPVLAPASPERGMSAPELSRRITHIIATAADRVGAPYPPDRSFNFESLAHRVLLTAQRSSGHTLSATSFQHVYRIWSILRRARLARGDDEAAEGVRP
jgi:hypothetical protein